MERHPPHVRSATLKRKRLEADLKAARSEEKIAIAHHHRDVAVGKLKAALDGVEEVKALSDSSDAVLAALAAALPRDVLGRICDAHAALYEEEKKEHDEAAVVVILTVSEKGKSALSVISHERVGPTHSTVSYAFNETRIPMSADRGYSRLSVGHTPIRFDSTLLGFAGGRAAHVEVYHIRGKRTKIAYNGPGSTHLLHGFDSPLIDYLKRFSTNVI
jgi:hypothetical protein